MRHLIVILFLFVLLVSSCKKDKFSDVQASEDDIFAQITTAKIFALVNDLATGFFYLSDTLMTNPLITVSPDTFPKKIIINYFEEIILDNDDRLHGIISVNLSDSLNSNENIITVTFDGFKFNDVRVYGSFSASVDTVTSNWSEYTFLGSSIKFKLPSDKEFSWSLNQKVVLSRGLLIPENFINDIYYFYGNSSGKAQTGRNFSAYIKDSLVFDKSCHLGSITSGKKELIPNEYSMRLIDFGKMNCNRSAKIVFESSEYIYEF